MFATATTADRTKLEHIADVTGVRWRSEDGEACIISLSDGVTAHGQTDSENFLPGVTYRFMGRWKHNPKYGDQFHFDTFVVESQSGEVGVVEYLTMTCPGIGRGTAKKLWNAYQGAAVQVLRETPGRVVDDGLLSDGEAMTASHALNENKARERTRIALYDLLKGKGFHGKIQDQLIDLYGAKAPAVIRKDPFKMRGMAGAGFKRCDKLWIELGKSPRRLRRQMYAAIEAIRQDRAGHTWLTAQRAMECCQEALGFDARPTQALKMGLRCKKLSHHIENGVHWITLAERNEDERSISTSIKRLTNSVSRWPKLMLASGGEVSPSEHQIEEISNATASPVGVFIGGPGSGKTFTLAFLLREVVERFGKDTVAVCAPTGKAAVRATESLKSLGLSIKASTIHSLLQMGPGGGNFLHGLDHPLPHRFIIVDESSMIDASLMASLLEACTAGTHVLFIGDPYQLPPVGVGAPLRDIIAANVATGELVEIRRNAGRIVHACQSVKAGRAIEWSAKIDLEAGENLKLVNVQSSQIVSVVSQVLAGLDKFDPVWQTQIVVGLNDKGNCSRVLLNGVLQNQLNPHGRTAPRCKFRVGDKIICLKNAQLKQCFPKSTRMTPYEREDVRSYKEGGLMTGDQTGYTANGEIGRVIAVGDGHCVATFNDGETLVKIGARAGQVSEGTGDTIGGDSDFDLAYAVTCHKLQGSEAPFVIVVADDAATSIATREWWYTAISRSKDMCVVIGPESTVAKQALRESTVRRKTFLRERITKAMLPAPPA